MTPCIQVLSALALRRLARSGCFATPADNSSSAQNLLGQSQDQIARALRQANASAWLAVEVVLVGEPLWQRAQLAWERSLDAEFYRPLRGLLDLVEWQAFSSKETTSRSELLAALRLAVQKGVLTSGDLQPGWLLAAADCNEQRNHGTAEYALLDQLIQEIEHRGGVDWRVLLELRCRSGESLLVSLVAALFRYYVEADSDLFGELAISIAGGFREQPVDELQPLAGALVKHRAQLLQLLADVRGLGSSPPEADAGVCLRRGTALAQSGDYESAIVEFTAAIRADPSLTVAYAQRGDAYRQRGEWALALADYAEVLQANPSSPLVLIHRARIHATLGEHEQALADFTAALELEPRNVIAYHCRGRIQARAGHHDAAIGDFTQALELDPHYHPACQERGEAYAALGAFDQAIADYSRALQLDALATVGYLRRGDAYFFKNEHERAIADYGNALRLDPLNVWAYQQRGVALRQLQNLDSAIADFGRALGLDPSNAELYCQRGLTFQSSDQCERALEDFDAAVRLDAENPVLYYRRGQVLAAVDASAEAIADMTEAIRLDADYSEAFHSRGLFHAAAGDTDRALDDYRAALRIDPSRTDSRVELARVLVQIGEFREAVLECDQALRLEPGKALAHLVRGMALVPNGIFETAFADFTRAIQLDPNSALAHYHRGLVHARRSNLASALADLTESARLDPDSARTYAHRGLIHWKAGKTEQALADLAHAVQLDGRYALTYCNMRGLAHASQGRYHWAVADFSVSLQLDPRNANAAAGRARFLKVLEAHPRSVDLDWIAEQPPPAKAKNGQRAPVVEAPAPIMPAERPARRSARRKAPITPRAALLAGQPETPTQSEFKVTKSDLATEVAEQGLALTDEPEPTPAAGIPENSKEPAYQSVSAGNLQDADSDSAEFELNIAASQEPSEPDRAVTISMVEVEPLDRDTEQRKIAEQLKAQYQAAQRNQERKATETARQAQNRWRRQRDDDDGDEPFHVRWRKQLIQLGSAAAALVVLWYGWGFYKTHRKTDAPLPIEAVWQAFKDNPQAANKKYSNQRLFIVGKLLIEQKERGAAREVFFKTSTEGTPQVHCSFQSYGELAEEPDGITKIPCLISGELEPYSEGPYLELKKCEFIGPSPQLSALGSVCPHVECALAAMMRIEDVLPPPKQEPRVRLVAVYRIIRGRIINHSSNAHAQIV